MSADNAIFIQRRLDGRWWVWMGFLSDDVQEPDPGSRNFASDKEAILYAQGWLKGAFVVEYGIRILDAQNPPIASTTTSRCPHCGRTIEHVWHWQGDE